MPSPPDDGARGDNLAETINHAIGEWLADNGGGMLNGFVVSVNYLDEDGAGSWAVASMPRQAPAMSLGLIRWAQLDIETGMQIYLAGLHEDDDE